jgi:processive 1,2-diacylglycerol beta-glucosyltransferase
MPRVLVLSASVGGGHLRAAEAVEAALKQTVPDVHVENHDVLQFTNAVFRRLYGQAYLDLVNRVPHVVGYVYDWLDQPSRTRNNAGDRLRHAVEKANLKKLTAFLTSQPWDLVINTHFLPAELIAHMRREGQLTLKQTTVCTDFETHRLWINQPCERYFTATPEGAEYLKHWGVPAADIEVSGIPVVPPFSRPADRAACLAKHELADDRPVILQLCGGFGVGPVEAMYRALLDLPQAVQLVIVCGRNEELKGALGKITVPPRHRVKLLGFTRVIDELMGCADLIVSKPGGLTTSEALARGVPMAIVNPIPGQESRNSDYLLENGAAIKINHPALLQLKLSRLLGDPERLARMRQSAKSLGHPQAAFDVVWQSLALIDQPEQGVVK